MNHAAGTRATSSGRAPLTGVVTGALTSALRPLATPVASWAQRSQRQACRNAMVSSTAISAQRRERDEVQEYVEELLVRRARRHTGTDHAEAPAVRLG